MKSLISSLLRAFSSLPSSPCPSPITVSRLPFAVCLFIALIPLPAALCQIPQGFNYQAIAKDGSGNPIASQSLPVRISIQSDSLGGTIFWVELHSSVTTNSSGLFTLVVGKGEMQSGTAATFSAIDWSVWPKYIQTEIDYGGWKTLGSSKMWSVPYAMVSTTSDTWTTSGSDIYRSTGNVGIGTSTPIGSLGIATNSGGTYLSLINSSTGGRRYLLGSTGLGNGQGEGKFVIWDWDASANRFTIDPAGNVGIGTTDPGTYKLSINGGDVLIKKENGLAGVLKLAGHGYVGSADWGNLNLYAGVNGGLATMIFSTENAERMYITGIGNVGIGVWPEVRLHVRSNDNITGKIFSSNTIGTSLEISNQTVSNRYQLSIGGSGNTVPGAFAIFDSHLNQSRLLIQPDGKVGIGTITPAGKLSVQVPTDAWADDVPLFEVKNEKGVPVFAVYNYGVRVLVDHNSAVKAPKGGFQVSSYDYTKAGGTTPLMIINPDSIRFNIDNSPTKGAKGGFSVGSFADAKGIDADFMHLTPQLSNSGNFNTFLGYRSGYLNGPGASNVFIGYHAGYTNYGPTIIDPLNGNNNVYIGTFAGEKNLGSNNVLIGDDAGKSLTNGNKNLYLGSLAGVNDINGDYNTYLGIEAGRYETGSDNVLIGYGAGYGAGESNLLAIGNRNNNGLITGYFNTKKIYLWGDVKIESTNAAPRLHLKGEGNVMNIEGSTYCYMYWYPDGIGSGAKAFMGYGNGTSNDFVIENLNSAGNIQINPGSAANVQIYNLLSGVGTALVVDANGKIYKSISDERLKENIIPLNGILEKVLQLQGVSYSLKSDGSHNREYGLLAQEVEKILPDLVLTYNDGIKGVKYQEITALLIEGIKEQQNQIETQNDKIEALTKAIQEMKIQIASLRSQ